MWFSDPERGDKSQVTLRCDDLQLPADKAARGKQWKQIGSLEQESLVVVQCQLVPAASELDNQRLDDDGGDGFRLGALYLSVPY